MEQTKNTVFITLGFTSLVLGTIGIFLPLLPTVPFILLAAYFFNLGSPKLHAWLLATPQFGPALTDWQKTGAIRKINKLKATALISISWISTILYSNAPNIALLAMTTTLLFVLIFIWSRPNN